MAATKAELEKILNEIEGLAEEALDPENTREEVIAKVKEIYDLIAVEEEPEEEEEDGEPGEE